MSPTHKDSESAASFCHPDFSFLSLQERSIFPLQWDLRVGTTSIVEARSLAHAVTSAVTD
jgi:hypothetical protein